MTITRDSSQDCSNTSASATTLTATYPATATAGRLLVAVGFLADQKLVLGGPSGWTKAADVEHSSQTFSTAVYYKIAAGSETGATFTTSGSAAAMGVAAYQYSGMVSSSPLDKTASNQNGGSQTTSLATGTTAATSQASELVISAVHINGSGTNITWASGTELFEGSAHQRSVAERIVSATGTYNDTASWTSSLFGCALIVTFKGAGGRPKVYVGGVWTAKPLKVYSGGSWVEKPVKRYNGSSWVTVT